ncbi:hypothetical protein BR93DRAFT_964583 [Coniochaeta sp. PMI_546]|nr:hypothetical protein BR93DRAFT_964583 [Coniochaeta sp. PMI_546]
MSTSHRDAPLNLLSLDGGGVRGVSELVILDCIMRRVQEKEGLDEVPRPCDYFDLMAGTSTGGLIALLLGRLQMTTQEALSTYDQVAKSIFSWSNRKLKADCQFKASTLKDAVERIVAQRNRGDLLIDPHAAQRKGKAFVCAADASDLDVAQLFRTYETADGADGWLKDCTIWEAARATTAAPTYFKAIEIKGDSVTKTFIDGAVSCNNPTDKMLEETGRVFSPRQQIGAILSIGTGTKAKSMPTPTDAGQWRYLAALFKMMKNQTVDTEHVHLALKKKFENFPKTYFRINVPNGGNVGLADWGRMSALKALTEDYLKQPDVADEIEDIAEILARKTTTGITVGHVSCLTRDDLYIDLRTARPMGSASHKFVGRRDILQRLDAFFSPRGANVRGRRQFLLCGMGGAGKTQIALKFKYIFWVDAENLQTARQSFRDIAITEMGQQMDVESSMEVVQTWIASLRDEWLLLLDNGNAALLERIVPSGSGGNILYTSRDQDLGLRLPPEAVAVVNDLELNDAVALLITAAGFRAHPENLYQEAEPIAIELGCLALAVDQAGSYIFMRRCTLPGYLRLLRERRAEILRDERYKGHDARSLAVYATFDISYQAVKALSADQEGHFVGEDARNALKILELICFYHNEGVPEEMFQRAAVKRHRKIRKGIWDRSDDGAVPLNSLFCVDDDGKWLVMPFRFGAMLLEQFSLVKQDRSRGNISMHILIRSWAGDRMGPEHRKDRILCARTILCFAIPKTTTPEPYDSCFRRKLYPHAKALQQFKDVMHADDLIQSSVDMQLGYLAQEAGDYFEAEQAFQRAIEVQKLTSGLDDIHTLKSLTALAHLYERQARYGEAESLLLEVRDRVEHTIGPDTKESVDAWWNLVNTYTHQTCFDAAENAAIQVLERKMRLLKTNDPNHEKLSSTNAWLAKIRQLKGGSFGYGTVDESEANLERCLQEYDDWDDRTLRARQELGEALTSAGRLDEAEPQFFRYAKGCANRYGPDDPRTLGAFTRYANLRLDQGHTIEAEGVLRDNLGKTQTLRGERDIEALHMLFCLGRAIALQGRFDEGILLMEKARELQEVLVGPEHLAVTKACEGIAQMVERATNTTFTERRMRARRAIATINPDLAASMLDSEIDEWSTSKHYTFSPKFMKRPELVYLTREERNRATRFRNLSEPLRETALELPIELLDGHPDRGTTSSEEFV